MYIWDHMQRFGDNEDASHTSRIATATECIPNKKGLVPESYVPETNLSEFQVIKMWFYDI